MENTSIPSEVIQQAPQASQGDGIGTMEREQTEEQWHDSQEGTQSNVYIVPRQRKKYQKTTIAEYDERIQATMDCIVRGMTDWQIKKEIAERFGQSTRTVEGYLRQARIRLVRSTGLETDELRQEQLARYFAVLDDVHLAPKDRLRALERIDKILGLEIHTSSSLRRVEVSGPNGAPIQTVNATLDLSAKLGEYAGAVRQAVLASITDQSQVQQDKTDQPS